MTESLAASVATALATGTTAALSDGVRMLLTKLVAVVRERFQRDASDQAIMAAAIREPQDSARVEHLIAALERHIQEDPAFGERVRSLWIEIAESARRAGVTNVVSGEVHGPVLQARDVQGGITFHPPPPH